MNIMQMRKEIGTAFKNLHPEVKCKYIGGRHRGVGVNCNNVKYVSRCVPERLSAMVANLMSAQRDEVSSIGFGKLNEMKCGRLNRKLCEWLVERVDMARSILNVHGTELELRLHSFGYIMGISYGGLNVELDGNMEEVSGYLKLYKSNSNGIHIKKLADILRHQNVADDQFKVTFTLFALCSVLCPAGGVHISSSFLFALKDVERIRSRNWVSFCFGRFMQGITKYREEKLSYIGGCLLYLQVFVS